MKHGALGSKGRRLAAYLLTYPNRTHRREYLTELFWDSDDVNSGRNALNTALWRLRRILDQNSADPQFRPLSVADEVMLELEDATIVDAHKFQQVATSFLDGNRETQCWRKLLDTLTAYQGRFLDGEDDLWVIEERERLHCMYVRVLMALMHRFACAGQFEDALECGKLILRDDPLREIVQRNVIFLYVLNGQQAEAIQQFERCRELLWNECNVRPMPQTAALADLIRSGSVFAKIPELSQSFFDTPTPA